MKTYLARLARRAASIVAECNYAQRRMLSLRTAPDTFLPDPDKAPDHYAEFLFRTSSTLLHEPAASGRAYGQPVG
jgi:hypothetical protein